MYMPFGKHRGEPIESIDRGYLTWVLANVSDLDPLVKQAIEQRLSIGAPPIPVGSVLRSDIDERIRGWHRKLAMDYHPDRRGSTAAMAAINDAYDRLRKALSL